ncbi:MAG: mannitol dehydrogenase family protein [Granulosicoccus sp.]
MQLSNKTLSGLPDEVLKPGYDRSSITPGIVHIGLGNFHRAHQSWYLHRLMQQGMALDWGIIGAGVLDYDRAQRQKLLEQDYLTTLIELDPAGSAAEVVGSMIGYVPIEEGNAALIEQLAEPAIRIVSLTVTEGGYYQAGGVDALDTAHPDIAHDSANPETPRTAFGAIVAALKRRRERGHGAFTAQCCDNLQGNGDILRSTVVSLARMSDPELANWIDTQCSFPNAMVDCIVPATGPDELAMVKALGIDDQIPVTHENFRQWVIEDDFCAGRPPWEKVGVTLTDDVHAYESMKIRILNGGHQIIANAGEILSVETISACMEDKHIGELFRTVAMREIVPHVQAVPGMSPQDYVELIDTRFSNPRILDTTRRVAFDGSSRHIGFVLPVVREALKTGAALDGLALSEALWARMCEGTREDGSVIEPNDPHWDELVVAAKAARENPHAWLAQRQYYGELADHPAFAETFAQWLQMIWSDGARVAIAAYLGEHR